MIPTPSLDFPLASLLTEPAGSILRLDLADITIPLDDELELAMPIEGSLEISRTNRGVLVHARFATALASSCSRCLGPAVVPLDVSLREEVLPSTDLLSGRALDRDAEPDVARLTDHHELDLAPLLREAVSLAEPIAPLCRPDCPGLCAECGERLDGHSAHERDAVDPRLAALRAFRVDGEPQSE